MPSTIAGLSLRGSSSDDGDLEITVEVGTLASTEDDPNIWTCPVSVRPFHDRLPDVRGGDSFQALCAAISLAQEILRNFRARGGLLFVTEKPSS